MTALRHRRLPDADRMTQSAPRPRLVSSRPSASSADWAAACDSLFDSLERRARIKAAWQTLSDLGALS